MKNKLFFFYEGKPPDPQPGFLSRAPFAEGTQLFQCQPNPHMVFWAQGAFPGDLGAEAWPGPQTTGRGY